MFKAIIFDFDGVIGKGLFYQPTMQKGYPETYSWLQKNVFGDKELVDNWMRGAIDSCRINNLISQNCGMDYKLLTRLFEKSVSDMKLDRNTLRVAQELKKMNKKMAIVSNNMDVFSIITAKRKELAEVFDLIINSSDYGMVKKDNGGELYRIALSRLDSSQEEALLIDDSENAVEIFTKLGGYAHHFTSIDQLMMCLRYWHQISQE